ncbi:phosphatidylserine decarboxylase [Candidatus Babeliales bacterium]|nr:phosphatidylserine decarboxylase [Candidatus Babeliales bacterium]
MNKTPRSLRFFYKSKAGYWVRSFLTKGGFNKLAGYYANSRISRLHISSFAKKNGIDIDECSEPLSSYKTFNEFFIRRLKPDARVIEEGDIVSPVDGKLFVINNISKADNFFVKSKEFNLKTFLGDKKLASEFENGTMLIFRLSPSDYHRIHFPFNCVPSEHKVITGKFDSVNPIAYEVGEQPLMTNERHLIKLNSNEFDKVVMVLVGALCVGKVVETYVSKEQCEKGGEVGYFAFGGSTIVLLLKEDTILIDDHFVDNSKKGYESSIKMGTKFAKKFKSQFS